MITIRKTESEDLHKKIVSIREHGKNMMIRKTIKKIFIKMITT